MAAFAALLPSGPMTGYENAAVFVPQWSRFHPVGRPFTLVVSKLPLGTRLLGGGGVDVET